MHAAAACSGGAARVAEEALGGGAVQATQEKVAALMQAAEARDGRRASARGAKNAPASSPGGKVAGSGWRVRHHAPLVLGSRIPCQRNLQLPVGCEPAS